MSDEPPALINNVLPFARRGVGPTALDISQLVITIILAVDVFAAIGIIFFERRDSTNTTGWLVTVLFLPVVGLILYLIFGFHYFREKQFRLKTGADRQRLAGLIGQQELGIQSRETEVADPSLAPYLELARMLLLDNNAFALVASDVEVFTDGHAYFEALLESIRKARHHIHLEYYIIRNDDLGRRLIAALTEKAKQGVEVRLLYDDMGNEVPRRHYKVLVAAGGRVSGFYRALMPNIGLRVNYRNHRKIAIIDGVEGFVGGFNVGVEYLGQGRLGHWRDTAVRIRGDAVKGLQLRFFLDWNYAAKEGLAYETRYFPPIESKGDLLVQIVSGGPDTRWQPTKEQYLKMVNIARKTIYLQTPYFIPDDSLLDSLRMAALSGVDVRIMIPCKPDHPFVFWANRSYIGDLLDAGVKAYEYNNGFIHAKTATVDDICSSIGSANWDIRSFKWNFESNALIWGKEFSEKQRLVFEEDLKFSTEITREAYAKRSPWVRIKESLSRLFAAAL